MGTTQIKGHAIGVCCYSTKHASLRSKSKELLAQNLDNLPEWRVMTTCGSLFQWTGPLQSGHHYHLIEM